MIWSDEFDGSGLDASKWTPQIGDGCAMNLCGWGNNELQYYRSENAEVVDGVLRIIAKREAVGGKSYTSARLRTKDKAEWTYGRFEARIKLPTGKGIWPAFWMLSTTEPYGSWPQSGEIDIMELIGSQPSTVHGTIHFGPPPPNNRSSGASYSLNTGIFQDDFHTFAVEWEASVLRWYVDDYLYSTKIRSVVGGSRWPFDHDFHLLLNLAVGGNWPGAPDGSTMFPQTMEVDYVRIYDGYKPAISGSRSVAHQAAGVEYQVHQVDAQQSITWQLPDGATIVAGHDSPHITVDWGEQGGPVWAIFETDCGPGTLRMEVHVDPPFERQVSFENFDEPGSLTFDASTGILTDDVANPAPNDVNSSALCGRYVRNASEQFDVLSYNVQVIDDAGPYIRGAKKFYIDVFTDAPAGTLILLQLENDARSQPDNFPSGRNSRFESRTTTQNAWERLEFSFLDQPDAATNNATIDQMILLFGSNTNLGSTFYFDNLDSYAPRQSVGVTSRDVKSMALHPNPADDQFTISDKRVRHVSVVDVRGTTWLSLRMDHDVVRIDGLPAGVYVVHGHDGAGQRWLAKLIKL